MKSKRHAKILSATSDVREFLSDVASDEFLVWDIWSSTKIPLTELRTWSLGDLVRAWGYVELERQRDAVPYD